MVLKRYTVISGSGSRGSSELRTQTPNASGAGTGAETGTATTTGSTPGAIVLSDYSALLRDVGVGVQAGTEGTGHLLLDSGSLEGEGSLEVPHSFTNVMAIVRQLLRNCVRETHKSVEDIYRMFVRWDSGGTGHVTATQFLRVLARLHVNLSDQDQDFLVELLDTGGQGRVNFESLLTFCFPDLMSSQVDSTTGSAEKKGDGRSHAKQWMIPCYSQCYQV